MKSSIRTLVLLAVVGSLCMVGPTSTAQQIFQPPSDPDVPGPDTHWSEARAVAYGTSTRHVGWVLLDASLDLANRNAGWEQAGAGAGGPPVKFGLSWNCVDDNGGLPNSSCSGGWRESVAAAHTNSHSAAAVYPLNQDEKYWFDYYYGWNPLGYNVWWSFPMLGENLTTEKLTCVRSRTPPCQFI